MKTPKRKKRAKAYRDPRYVVLALKCKGRRYVFRGPLVTCEMTRQIVEGFSDGCMTTFEASLEPPHLSLSMHVEESTVTDAK